MSYRFNQTQEKIKVLDVRELATEFSSFTKTFNVGVVIIGQDLTSGKRVRTVIHNGNRMNGSDDRLVIPGDTIILTTESNNFDFKHSVRIINE